MKNRNYRMDFGFATIYFTMEVMDSYNLVDLWFNKLNAQSKESALAQLNTFKG